MNIKNRCTDDKTTPDESNKQHKTDKRLIAENKTGSRNVQTKS